MKTELTIISDDLNHGIIDEKEARTLLLSLLGVGGSGCLYAFLYNSCIHESSWATVSLHYSKEGAEKAMQEHKQKALDEFNEMYANDNEFDFKFGEHEDWRVEPVEVLP